MIKKDILDFHTMEFTNRTVGDMRIKVLHILLNTGLECTPLFVLVDYIIHIPRVVLYF